MSIAIAIDGPAGAGKSTISKAAAKRLGFIYVDTGALYRAIGLSVSREGIDPDDADEVSSLLSKIKVGLSFNENNEQIVTLNGEDVSAFIRTPEISMLASSVSKIPSVRAFLLDLQRNMANTSNIIMDGRDIGTVVLPNAKVKIFLTASPEIRAKRRYDELVEKGMQVCYDDVLKDVIERDYNDSHRDISPLKPADDAVLVDTSGETLEQSVNRLITVMKEHM